MKRMLAWILSLCMVLSMLPAQVFAEETQTAYTVTYDANGGSGTMAAQTITAGNPVLSPNAFNRTCHAFAGWNTAADGSGTGYADGAEVSLTADTTLYAQWKAVHRYEYTRNEPGCTAAGSILYRCADCGDNGWESVAALGHSWTAATCTAPKTCTVCAATEGETLGHTEVTDAAKAPTCTETGLTEGKHCSVCDEVLVKQETVAALGHTGGEAASCTTAQTCKVCGAELVAALGHTEVIDGAVAPTCTETGLTEGKHCSVCNEILVKQETIAALGHTGGEAASCTTAQTCQVCGTELAAALGHTEVIDGAVAPTCTETGLTEGKHCSVCNEILVAQQTVPAIGHTYENLECVNCGETEPLADGQLGGSLTWRLDKKGLLTISGTGDITESPWKQYSAQIEKVIIGDGVTAIGADAFADCVNLKTLSFPGSARVESKAFSGCTGLTAITVTAGSGAMYDYDVASGQNLPWYQTEEKNLTVKLAQGVTSVGAFAFCGAENVTGVELPDTLKTIHASAFSGSALTALSIPMGVERIDDHALANLKSIQTLTIPGSVQTLGVYALSASSFRAVELPSGLEAISKGLFKDCTQLSTVMLPDSVQTIGEEAFYNCQTLYGVNVPKDLKVIEKNTFRNCTVLNNIYLPEGLTTIGEYAFAGNENLTKLTIPASVTEIRQNAFNGCKWLDTLVIQSTAFVVQENAFSGCEKLKKVYFAGTEAAWKALLENMGSGNNSLKTASVSCAGDGEDVYNPVQEVQIYFGEERVDGRILLIDLNKTESITLGYKVFPEDAANPEISWTTNDLNMTDSSRDADGKLTLTNMKPGDMTLYAQNFVSGSKEDYTYTTASVRLQFRRVVISGGLNGYLSQDVPTQLTAQILGDGETNRGILWRVENQDGEATIDAKGVIKGTKNGQVIVYAEAADGSGLMASQTFTVSGYAVSITGPDTVASGKSITLKAELIPENLTGTTIKWSLEDPEDHQYVTLNNGKLTAKKGIQEKRNVTVVASAADGQAASAKKTVTVVPVTGSVAIMHGQNTVTGQTVAFDLNRGENTITFAAVTAPADASKQVTWKVSDTKGAYVAYTANDDGTITLTPTGMTGTVTLTATAADGSGKKATVKVQLVRTAQSIEILNAPKAIRGGSKVTLSTNLAKEEGLTDRNVVWSLSQESLPFASINAKGVLTTYAFPGAVTITVCAAIKANPEVEAAQVTIDLLPGAQAAQIRLGDKILTKGEIVYAEVGEEVKLSGSTLPAGADQGGAWKVSGKIADWAPSEDGKTVTLRLSSAGTVTVTFTAGDGSKKNTSVKVQGVERGKELTISAKGDAKELRSGKSLQLTAAVAGATVKKFNWTVSDPSLATVSATGKVKALTVYENKTITVTATAIDGSGLTAEYPLVLKPAKDETLHIFVGGKTVTGTTQYVSLGAEAQPLEVKLYNAVDNTWTDVKDANITVGGKALQVNDGKITPTAVGSGTVTAKYSKLAAKVTCKVVRSVEAITITAPGSWLLAGKTMKLTAAVTAAEGAVPTVKKVSWSVDNPDAATISSSGSLKAGKNVTQRTTVTVTAAATDGSGVTQTFQVEIYPQVTAILVQDGITGQILNMCTREFRVGDKLDLAALIYPKDAKQDVIWSISSAKLAELDTENSIITLKSKGTLTIKATVNDGSRKSISVKIKIIEA